MNIENQFTLHPQLAHDCHRLGWLKTSYLLLHRDSSVMWFIVVPVCDQLNVLDLPQSEREALLDDLKSVSDHLRSDYDYERVNVAWLGNMVPQLHVHVIGRRVGDACWPKPVWGHLGEPLPYSSEALAQLRTKAVAALHLNPDAVE